MKVAGDERGRTGTQTSETKGERTKERRASCQSRERRSADWSEGKVKRNEERKRGRAEPLSTRYILPRCTHQAVDVNSGQNRSRPAFGSIGSTGLDRRRTASNPNTFATLSHLRSVRLDAQRGEFVIQPTKKVRRLVGRSIAHEGLPRAESCLLEWLRWVRPRQLPRGTSRGGAANSVCQARLREIGGRWRTRWTRARCALELVAGGNADRVVLLHAIEAIERRG